MVKVIHALIGEVVTLFYDPCDLKFFKVGFMEHGYVFDLKVPNTQENLDFMENALMESKHVFVEADDEGVIQMVCVEDVQSEESEDDEE